MAIVFHCEHCSKEISAPPESGGKRGKCPHCNGVNYIPSQSPDEVEMYDLSPVNPDEERRRQREEAVAHDIQRKLLHERVEVQGGEEPVRHKEDDGVRPGDLRALLVDYLGAMSRGHLEEADRGAFAMSRSKKEVLAMIDRISMDDVASAELSNLPRPVMLGFLRQLRSKL